MKKPNIAILGASGLVGQKILTIMEQEKFPVATLKLLGNRSVGQTVVFKKKTYTIEPVTADSFSGIDIVLASAGTSVSKKYASWAVQAGAVFIDNSNAFRMDKQVPLVLVGVNDTDILTHQGIIANPNCATSQLMPVLAPLHQKFGLKKIIVSTYQAVSGAGGKGITELEQNMAGNITPVVFPHEIAFNVIPQIDDFEENGYSKEEMKLVRETKKILHLKNSVKISCTAVRVPVVNGHSEAVTVEFAQEITPQQVKNMFKNNPYVTVLDNPVKSIYPTPKKVSGKNPVFIGRIRKDLVFKNGISFWCVADNLRIGAALNTVRIAQKVLEFNALKKGIK